MAHADLAVRLERTGRPLTWTTLPTLRDLLCDRLFKEMLTGVIHRFCWETSDYEFDGRVGCGTSCGCRQRVAVVDGTREVVPSRGVVNH
jgi:hypothetical protein